MTRRWFESFGRLFAVFGRKKRRQDPIAAPASPDVGAWIPYDRSASTIDAVAEIEPVQSDEAPGGGSPVSRETDEPPAGVDLRLGETGLSEVDVHGHDQLRGRELGEDHRSADLGAVAVTGTSMGATATADQFVASASRSEDVTGSTGMAGATGTTDEGVEQLSVPPAGTPDAVSRGAAEPTVASLAWHALHTSTESRPAGGAPEPAAPEPAAPEPGDDVSRGTRANDATGMSTEQAGEAPSTHPSMSAHADVSADPAVSLTPREDDTSADVSREPTPPRAPDGAEDSEKMTDPDLTAHDHAAGATGGGSVTAGFDGAGSAPVVLGHDAEDLHRAALVESLPDAGEDTPLMAQIQEDARRRIELRGRKFPKPLATRVITVANQKGGVGKTTTTVNMAAALAQAGLNVLVLDNDPQGNASTALGIDHRAGTPSIYEVLVEGASMAEAVQESPDVPRLWCLPATIDLSGAEIELVSMVARETRLRSALDAYLRGRIAAGQEPIDYVFVDCPPSLGLLTVNAFVVGREVLIPIQCEYYALEGLSQLLKTIQLIQAHLNPDLHVSTILLTMYDARTNLAQQVAQEVREHFPETTLRTSVPRSVRISEAPSYGQTVMTYDPGSTGALAYLEAARELAERAVVVEPGGAITPNDSPAQEPARAGESDAGHQDSTVSAGAMPGTEQEDK
jgi:chromosome partitioning protein